MRTGLPSRNACSHWQRNSVSWFRRRGGRRLSCAWGLQRFFFVAKSAAPDLFALLHNWRTERRKLTSTETLCCDAAGAVVSVNMPDQEILAHRKKVDDDRREAGSFAANRLVKRINRSRKALEFEGSTRFDKSPTDAGMREAMRGNQEVHQLQFVQRAGPGRARWNLF